MPQLILIRHGQSAWNLENRFTGWWDVDLTDKGRDEARAAGELLAAKGVDADLCFTSLQTRDTPPDVMDMLAVDAEGAHLLRTPLLPLSVNGAGDAVAALFLFHHLRTGQAQAALEAAGSAIHGLLRRTAEAGSREILTVAAQDEFASPTIWYRAQPARPG